MSNLFLQVTSDVDGYHLDNNVLVALINNNCPHAECNLTQISKCNYPIFQNYGTCRGVEEIKFPLMVMLASLNPDEIPEIC